MKQSVSNSRMPGQSALKELCFTNNYYNII